MRVSEYVAELMTQSTKPAWMNRVHADWVAFLAVFTAMILMHFGL